MRLRTSASANSAAFLEESWTLALIEMSNSYHVACHTLRHEHYRTQAKTDYIHNLTLKLSTSGTESGVYGGW